MKILKYFPVVLLATAGLSSAANAAVLGQVYVRVLKTTNSAWSDSWGAGWNECRSQHPRTRSIVLVRSEQIQVDRGGGNWVTAWNAWWNCRDTP